MDLTPYVDEMTSASHVTAEIDGELLVLTLHHSPREPEVVAVFSTSDLYLPLPIRELREAVLVAHLAFMLDSGTMNATDIGDAIGQGRIFAFKVEL